MNEETKLKLSKYIGREIKFYVRKLKMFFDFIVRYRKKNIVGRKTFLYLFDVKKKQYGSSLYYVGDNTFKFDLKNQGIDGVFYLSFCDTKKVEVIYEVGSYRENCLVDNEIDTEKKERGLF